MGSNPIREQMKEGRTTRLVDDYVQQFFMNGYVMIRDHFDDYRAHQRTFYLVINRLIAEHNDYMERLKREKKLLIDKTNLIIEVSR